MKQIIENFLTEIHNSLESNNQDKLKTSVNNLLTYSQKVTELNLESITNYLEKNDYYIAPGSTHYHDDEPMGLVKHSLRVVFWALKYFYIFFSEDLKDEENLGYVIISSLCHDLCKVNRFETIQKWKKDDKGNWVSYDTYGVKDSYKALGHGSESMRRLYYLCPQLPFKVQAAVYWHMGLFDSDDTQGFSKSYKEEPMVLCLVTADMLSTQRKILVSDCQL